MAGYIHNHIQFSSFFLSVGYYPPYNDQWALSAKFFPCIKPLVTPLNTRDTGAAQKKLIKQGFLNGGKFPTSGKFHPCSGKFFLI